MTTSLMSSNGRRMLMRLKTCNLSRVTTRTRLSNSTRLLRRNTSAKKPAVTYIAAGARPSHIWETMTVATSPQTAVIHRDWSSSTSLAPESSLTFMAPPSWPSRLQEYPDSMLTSGPSEGYIMT